MKINNRTPHPITIIPSGASDGAVAITLPAAPRGEVARVESSDIVMRRGLHAWRDGETYVECEDAPLMMDRDDGPSVAVPVVATRWGRVLGLPDPTPGVAHVVSVIVAAAAHAAGRPLDDLYVPGGQVRDASGRIVGCSSLCRARDSLPGAALGGAPRDVVDARWRHIADMLSMEDWAPADDLRDSAPAESQPRDTRRRVGIPTAEVAYLCRCHDAPRGYGGWWLVSWDYGCQTWIVDAADPGHLAGVNLNP